MIKREKNSRPDIYRENYVLSDTLNREIGLIREKKQYSVEPKDSDIQHYLR